MEWVRAPETVRLSARRTVPVAEENNDRARIVLPLLVIVKVVEAAATTLKPTLE